MGADNNFCSLYAGSENWLTEAFKTNMSAEVITWVRYLFGLPLVIAYLLFLIQTGGQVSDINNLFLFYCIVGGIAQIIGTALLVSLFSYRNFAVGTAYSNTEAIQTAILGMVLFGEFISFGGGLAIVIGVFGVLIISSVELQFNWRKLITSFTQKSALIGIGSGLGFAFAALFIRKASLSLGNSSPFISAAQTLFTIVALQTLILAVYLFLKQRQEIIKVIKNWKISALVGLASALGSIGWYTAVTLQNAAYVKTVGQVQLLFAILFAHTFFKERIDKIEIVGMTFIVGSVVLLLYFK